MKKYLVLLFALLFAVGALAQLPSFEEVDTNADGVIDRDEAAAVEGLDFDAADTNMDGVIDRQEYEAWQEQEGVPVVSSGTTTTIRVSLLRAPRFPDPETDQGTHRFRHALVPGAAIGSGSSNSSVGLPSRTHCLSRSICSCTSELGCGTTRQSMPSG